MEERCRLDFVGNTKLSMFQKSIQGVVGVWTRLSDKSCLTCIVLTFTAIKVFSFCRIFSKAGYSWAFGLLMLPPMSELVIPLVLAFMDWPVCKELRLFKQEQSSG